MAAVLVLSSASAVAQPGKGQAFALPAQDLGAALRQVAAQTGRDLVVPSALIAGRRSPALTGIFTPEEAVAALLAGSGLTMRRVDDSLVIVASSEPEEASSSESGSDIVVTGTRIRGAPIASPVITLGDQQIRAEGKATLAEAVRTIPQNFGGGQNPGIGNNVPSSSGVDVGSASSVNLRGLGSDATLTLVNGHRLSYSASRQSIDISSIPLGAVDRIEIVPDGASALYGSDAVAGVVNIILKRDFDGLATSARIGSSTDGGGFDQRYSAVAGTRWGGGGFVATYEFGRTSAILGRQRSYTEERSPSLTLFPFLQNHSATLSGHHRLSSNLRFEIDALYNKRVSDSSYASNPAGDISLSGARFLYDVESLVIAPTARLALGGSWNVFATGSYGQDRTRYDVTIFSRGAATEVPDNCYCNKAVAAEVGGDGPLFDLPAGRARLAVGVGYRNNDFIRFNGAGSTLNVTAAQDSYYAYGELSLPLVADRQDVPLVHRLQLSAAVRYEKYPDVGEVATPKLGLIYAPTPHFDLKASWGKSFRAPTLNQQFASRSAVLVPPAAFGGSGFAPTATALLLQGGNPDLKPERATSWSATLDIHPQPLPGARLEISYFNTRYRDRIVSPIPFLSQALSNPIYRDRVTLSPATAFLDEVLASTISFINATGRPYQPGDVAAFVDGSNVNAGYQKITGGDVLFSYQRELGARAGEIGLQLNATYLDSEQQTAAGQPVVQLAGIVFNPPHVRARAGLSWNKGATTVTSNATYIGSVRDTRRPPASKVDAMTTFDLTLRFQSPASSGPLSGLDASLSVQNLFNAKPDRIAATLFSDAPYDSTNYSPLGRFVALSLRKAW
ncbi:MAG TPA: TonB-dependent receptor [Sphingomonadaceae bacterium]|nr:TonB-dependent receptor [Sphingomonadaceae bacterium]